MAIDYKTIELPCESTRFIVDRCCQIEINEKSTAGDVFEFILDTPKNFECFSESGEDFEMLSFYCDDIKLSVGVAYEKFMDFKCEYFNDRMKISYNGESKVYCKASWKKMIYKEIEDIFTWFASDPSV